MGLQLWSSNEGLVIAKQVTWFSTPEEGTAKVQQDQGHVNCVSDREGIVHHEYTPPGQTINKEHYLNILHWLRDAIQPKWLQLRATGDWQFGHYNTPTHATCLKQRFFVKHQITQVTQPHYSPDLVLCNFWIFPKLKSLLKGKRFQTIDEIQENTTGQLMATPIKDFAECFEQWKRRW